MPAKKAMKAVPPPKNSGKATTATSKKPAPPPPSMKTVAKPAAMKTVVEDKKAASKKAAEAAPKKKEKVVEKTELEVKLEALGTVLEKDFVEVNKTHKILLSMYKPCLETPIENRERIQIQGIEMIETHMVDVVGKLDQKLEGFKEFIEKAPGVQSAYESKKESLTQALETLTQNKATIEKTVSDEESRQSVAIENVKQAKKFVKSVKDDYETLKDNLEYVKSVQAEKFSKLVGSAGPTVVPAAAAAVAPEVLPGQDSQEVAGNEGGVESEVADVPVVSSPISAKQQTKMIDEIVKICKNILKLEDTLVAAVPNALKRSFAERGMFDNITINEVEKSWRNWVMDSSYKIGTQDEREHDANQKLLTAESELESVEKALQCAEDMLKTVVESIKSNKKETREVIDDLKALPGKVDDAETEKTLVECAKEEFLEGFEVFKWLKERTEIVNVEEEVVMEEGGEGVHGASPKHSVDEHTSKDPAMVSSSSSEFHNADVPIQPQEVSGFAEDVEVVDAPVSTEEEEQVEEVDHVEEVGHVEAVPAVEEVAHVEPVVEEVPVVNTEPVAVAPVEEQYYEESPMEVDEPVAVEPVAEVVAPQQPVYEAPPVVHQHVAPQYEQHQYHQQQHYQQQGYYGGHTGYHGYQ